jgi:hypothetical protein
VNKFYSMLCCSILCSVQNEDTVLAMPRFWSVPSSELSQSVRFWSFLCVCVCSVCVQCYLLRFM